MITTLQKNNTEKWEKIATNVGEIKDKLETQFGANQNSAAKGAFGEKWVQDLLSNDPSFTVVPVAKNGMEGDFEVRFKNSDVGIMVEVKNYSTKRKITSADKDKSDRDLDANIKYNGGILVAVQGGLDSSIEEFRVYRTKGSKPYYFVADLWAKKNPGELLKILLFMLQTFIEHERSSSVNEKKVSAINNIVQSDFKSWERSSKAISANVKAAKKLHQSLQSQETIMKQNLSDLKRKWKAEMEDVSQDDNPEVHVKKPKTDNDD